MADGSTVVIGGSGAGHALPQRFIDELAAVSTETGRPRDLTTVRVVGIGDFADRGFSQLGLPGLMRRTIGSSVGTSRVWARWSRRTRSSPTRFRRACSRSSCARSPRDARGSSRASGWAPTSTRVETGGKQNARTTEDLVEVVTLRGREWLLFHALPIDVAVIRGTTADEDGNLAVEGEAVQGEMLAMAMAARNSGGIVIAQVPPARDAWQSADARREGPGGADRLRLRRSRPRWQPYITDSPYYAGALRRPVRPSRHCRSMSARSSPVARCWSSRPARSATSASASAS